MYNTFGHFTKPLLSGPKQFWITNCLDECLGDFVCVYDHNYTLLITIQPNE